MIFALKLHCVYILFTCVLALSQMFPTMFESREIHNFNQCNIPFHHLSMALCPHYPSFCFNCHKKWQSDPLECSIPGLQHKICFACWDQHGKR